MQPTATDLFERYHVAVYRYFLRSVGNADVAQDLTQDVFLRILRYLERFRPEREASWVFRITRNVLADRIRRPGPRHVPLSDVPGLHTEATQLVAFGLSEALALLPDQDREVFVLRELSGLSYAELAKVCDIEADSVRSRICRVRARLRALLGPRLSADESRRRSEER